MTVCRSIVVAAAVGMVWAGFSACSKPAATTTTTTQTAAPLAAVGATATPATTPEGMATAPPAPLANGYSCTFPGPGGRSILARFTLDATGAHDDQGLPFTVLTNSATALVLAHARDDLATAPTGDVGAYVVAIDRRSLGMVQSTVGLSGPGSTRRGRCIAG